MVYGEPWVGWLVVYGKPWVGRLVVYGEPWVVWLVVCGHPVEVWHVVYGGPLVRGQVGACLWLTLRGVEGGLLETCGGTAGGLMV